MMKTRTCFPILLFLLSLSSCIDKKDVVKFPAEDVLAGAAQPISRCVGNMIRFTNCIVKDAIQMASTNPAKVMGLSEIGEIKEGQRADLILFTMEDGEMVIHRV